MKELTRKRGRTRSSTAPTCPTASTPRSSFSPPSTFPLHPNRHLLHRFLFDAGNTNLDGSIVKAGTRRWNYNKRVFLFLIPLNSNKRLTTSSIAAAEATLSGTPTPPSINTAQSTRSSSPMPFLTKAEETPVSPTPGRPLTTCPRRRRRS